MVNVAKIAVGVLLAVALALGVYGWMLARAPQAPDPQAQASTSDSQPNASLSVVVAAQAVPAGQALKAEDLQLMQLPAKPDGAYGEIQAAIGAVPAVDIPKGAPVFQGQMVTGLALKLSEGERAVAVKVDESIGAGNRIRPGDFVDVFFALRRDGNEIDQSQARLLLSRKRVLAYGSASVDAVTTAEKTEGKQANGPDNARTAVLAVPVAEVNQLLLGGSSGSLLLALRNPTDMTEPDREKFAPLPGVLTVAMTKGSVAAPLEGADAAQAGVAMSSLAGSAGTSAARMSAAKPMSAGVTKPAVPRTRTASADSSLPVEFVRGANSQTVRY
ncbi:Flp pilus assembly protein CpaB [Comamonas testosteroni]|uniref:Flp pilus assembly protein CpaB n=1 Tax=Comamonas testosteroni (strain DSM 14576 / KF-1) TaxID=399795 RepID=B7X4B4_COMTK|nr:Flp pilus assembly protein CpaB [Comamonas testosteroni]EED70464.1 Flp pilus assembly protein CpaB [Comamonas testosteroni KF-1]WQG68386.1 Flp pilus assembly protein CpaB [Comamonas testosteroni]